MQKSKDFVKGERVGQTIVGTIFGMIKTFFVTVCPWLVRLIQKTNGTFQYVYAKKTGRMPAVYMYVLFWVVVLLLPKLILIVLKLLLPESILMAIDSMLAWTFTITLIVAVISLLKSK
jgi:hypothetical protein